MRGCLRRSRTGCRTEERLGQPRRHTQPHGALGSTLEAGRVPGEAAVRLLHLLGRRQQQLGALRRDQTLAGAIEQAGTRACSSAASRRLSVEGSRPVCFAAAASVRRRYSARNSRTSSPRPAAGLAWMQA